MAEHKEEEYTLFVVKKRGSGAENDIIKSGPITLDTKKSRRKRPQGKENRIRSSINY